MNDTNCDAIVIVYDICDENSFKFLKHLATKIRLSRICSKDNKQIPILMVGNKHDLQHLR